MRLRKLWRRQGGLKVITNWGLRIREGNRALRDLTTDTKPIREAFRSKGGDLYGGGLG